MVKVCGNFGAFPNPPHALSADFMILANILWHCSTVNKFCASTIIESMPVCAKLLDWLRCAVKFAACASISFFLSFHDCAIPCKTSFQEERLNALTGG